VNLWSSAGRSGSRQGPGAQDPAEQAVLLAVIALCVGGALILATGHLSALLFDGGWPRYPADEIPGVLGRAVTTPLDPGSGWDEVNEGAAPPGPIAWWLTFLVLAAAVAGPIVLNRRAGDRKKAVAGIPATTQRDLRRLRLEREDPSELVVGTTDGHEVALKSCHSLLVLGPARSGKTSAVTIPAVLEWPGPVVATSTAGDLVDHTIGWRSRQGDVHVFDPMGTTRHHSSPWSPLATCATWVGATRTAWDLAMAGKASIGTGSGVGEFWFSSAARSLAPYLFAAAESGRTMEDVARWIDAEDRDEVLAELRTLEPDAAVTHAATFRREAAARASLFHVMQQIVGAYLDPRVAASARRTEIECDELLDGGPHTLYITAPYHDQARVRPLFAALVRQMLGAVHEQVARTRRPLRAPLLLILDDAADIAPVEDLPTLAATSASAGVQVVTVFQDLTQIEVRHGQDAPAVLSNHRAKLLLPGSGGVDAVDLAEQLADDGGGQTAPRRALAPELARQLPADEAVFVYNDRAPMRVRLRQWYKHKELRRRSGVAQDAIAPVSGRKAPTFPPLIENGPPASDGPIVNPLPTPPPVDVAAFDDVDPDTYLVPPHFPPNVSPLSAARDRLRRRKTPDSDDGS
jgi:type IV secretory pathway TraG/TraD family ATPase VirD4